MYKPHLLDILNAPLDSNPLVLFLKKNVLRIIAVTFLSLTVFWTMVLVVEFPDAYEPSPSVLLLLTIGLVTGASGFLLTHRPFLLSIPAPTKLSSLFVSLLGGTVLSAGVLAPLFGVAGYFLGSNQDTKDEWIAAGLCAFWFPIWSAPTLGSVFAWLRLRNYEHEISSKVARRSKLRYRSLVVAVGIGVVFSLWYLVAWLAIGAHKMEGEEALRRGDYNAALSAFERQRDKTMQLGLTGRNLGESVNNMAVALYRMRRISEAEAAYRQALQLHASSVGVTHPEYIRTLQGLARVLADQSRSSEAEPLYLQVVAASVSAQTRFKEDAFYKAQKTFEHFFLKLHEPYYASIFGDTAKHYAEMKLYEQATGIPYALDGLATLHARQGDLRKAEKYQKRAFEMTGEILGGGNPNLARDLNTNGLSYDQQGKPIEGLALYDRIQPLIRHLTGMHQTLLADSMQNLAEIYRQEGRYIEAEPLYFVALSIYKKIDSTDSPGYANTLTNLGLLYNIKDQYERAEPKLLEALRIRQRIFDPENPEIAHSLNNLALLYDRQNRFDESERYYKLALEIRQKVLGETHPKSILTLGQLANLYFKRQLYREAEPLYVRLLQIQERLLGQADPETLNTMSVLAGILSEVKKYDDAVSLYRRLIPLFEEQYGPDNPHLIPILASYAHVLRGAGQTKEALTVEERIKEYEFSHAPITRKKAKPETGKSL